MCLVRVFNQQRNLPIKASSVRAFIREMLTLRKVQTDEVMVNFVTKGQISKLHQAFFNDPTSTDCISFPIDPPSDIQPFDVRLGHHVLGEVFVCPQVAIDYCNQKSLKDPYLEVSLYLVHSFLHLLGFNDQTDKERRLMRAEEKKLLNWLISKHLLLHP